MWFYFCGVDLATCGEGMVFGGKHRVFGGQGNLDSLPGSVTNLLRDLNTSLYLSVPQFSHALKIK